MILLIIFIHFVLILIEMMHSFQLYQRSLGAAGSQLTETIKFLENTSIIVRIFNDMNAILDFSDHRFQELRQVLNYFKTWELEVENMDIEKAEKQKLLLSLETRSDIESMLLGFTEMCR